MKVGFVGLGRMGQGMARRLLDAGHDLWVFDQFAAQAASLTAAGARAATSVAELAVRSDIVVTMLVEDAAVSEVAFGAAGLCDRCRKARFTSSWARTASPSMRAARSAASRGGSDARRRARARPARSRRQRPARHRRRGAGGRRRALQRAAASRWGAASSPRASKPESATAIKLANNAVLGCAMVAMAEGFALVRKYDVDAAGLSGRHGRRLVRRDAYKVYGQKMVDESYDQVGSPIHVGLKDANLIAAAADLARVPMPSHNVYRDRLARRRRARRRRPRSSGARREQARASGLE